MVMIKTQHKWQDWERDILRSEYDGTNLSIVRLADKLGTSFYGVKGQLARMGLLLPKSHVWSDKEIRKLEEMAQHYGIQTIARKLGRSVNAVAIKCKRLGLKRRMREGWYTQTEICEICGVGYRRVQRWVEDKSLKASWHNECKPQKSSGAMWHIEAKDFKQFLIKHSGELVGRNVDIQQIIWIIVDEVE